MSTLLLWPRVQADKVFKPLTLWLFGLLPWGKSANLAEDIITLPNLISLSRIVLGILVRQTARTMPVFSGMLFITGVYSDYADGTLARKLGITKSGSVVDPFCDKVFFFFSASVFRSSFNPVVFWSIVCLEIINLAAPPVVFLLLPGFDPKANAFGKWKFALECLSLTLVMIGLVPWGNAVMLLAIPFAASSIIAKLWESRKLAE
jgi:phosphatidylglycerophosphate synthase